MDIVINYLEKTERFKNLSLTDKRIFKEIFKKCVVIGKITDSNKNLSIQWNIPIRTLSHCLKKLKESHLIETEKTNLYDNERNKWYCKERSIYLNKVSFPFLSKQNLFTAEELALKYIFEQEILIEQNKELIKQNEILKNIALKDIKDD